MPLYEYLCPNCGHRFTQLQPMSAPREGNECPQCGKREARRVISTFASKGSEGSSCGPTGSPFR